MGTKTNVELQQLIAANKEDLDYLVASARNNDNMESLYYKGGVAKPFSTVLKQVLTIAMKSRGYSDQDSQRNADNMYYDTTVDKYMMRYVKGRLSFEDAVQKAYEEALAYEPSEYVDFSQDELVAYQALVAEILNVSEIPDLNLDIEPTQIKFNSRVSFNRNSSQYQFYYLHPVDSLPSWSFKYVIVLNANGENNHAYIQAISNVVDNDGRNIRHVIDKEVNFEDLSKNYAQVIEQLGTLSRKAFEEIQTKYTKPISLDANGGVKDW